MNLLRIFLRLHRYRRGCAGDRHLLPKPRRKARDYPLKQIKFTLQGYDRYYYYKSNGMFGKETLDLKDIMEDVLLLKNTLQLNKKYYTDVLRPKYK